MKVLVDNFAVLGIENCLLSMLPEMFSPDTVMKLDEGLTKNIAKETEDSLQERARVTRKLESLEAGLKTLNRLGRHKRFQELPGDTDSTLTSQLQKTSDFPDGKDIVVLDTTAASHTEVVIEEDREPLREENGALDTEHSNPQEVSPPLSPFRGSGSRRSANSWVNENLKQKRLAR